MQQHALIELHLLPGARAPFLRNSALCWLALLFHLNISNVGWIVPASCVRLTLKLSAQHVSTAIHSQMQVNAAETDLTLKPNRPEELDWNKAGQTIQNTQPEQPEQTRTHQNTPKHTRTHQPEQTGTNKPEHTGRIKQPEQTQLEQARTPPETPSHPVHPERGSLQSHLHNPVVGV